MASKPQRTDICIKCGNERPIHAKGRCKNCYMQDFPPKRKLGYCSDPYCPHIGKQVALVAKGKCQAC
jgi:ribosomal protein L40E